MKSSVEYVVDLDRKRRHVERITGATITVRPYEGEQRWLFIEAIDPELGGRTLSRIAHTEPQAMRLLDEIHNDIYHSRARERHRLQGGKCAHCGKNLGRMGECDHIESRGAHGRNDRLSNLQILCPPFLSGGCDYHRSKHAGGQRRTA